MYESAAHGRKKKQLEELKKVGEKEKRLEKIRSQVKVVVER